MFRFLWALLSITYLASNANGFVAPLGGSGGSQHLDVKGNFCSEKLMLLPKRDRLTKRSTKLFVSSEPDEDTVVIDADFRVSSYFLIGSLVFAQLPILKFVLSPLAALLGLLFLVQTFRLKFVCDSEAFELLNTSQASGENLIVGGKNRWTYDSFVNYEFFPKGWIDQPQGPILVYFKETQTPMDKWEKGPGASANSEQALADGAVPGQAHFFPALCNTQQLRAEWEKRGCTKM